MSLDKSGQIIAIGGGGFGIKPLIEEEIRHKAENCSWGHRWCNIAMTDHTIEETLEYFNHVVKEHNES